MNYGKKWTSKKRNSLTSRSSMAGKRAHVSFIRILFIGLLTLATIVVCAGFGAVKGIIDNAPDVSEIDIMPIGAASFVYDDQGNQLQKLTAPNSNRLPVSIDQIPENLQHAVVAIEDERFYEHNGIDVRGILRAGVKGITSGHFSEGASTITQQLLKNNVFTNWTDESTWMQKFTRKFQEQYLAIQVEKKINDKNVILENYLNTINLGAGAYGVQAAAHRYFDKDVWDLNLSECATIAGITQNPTKYNPITNPNDNAKRRKEVLNKMVEQGYITKAEYQEALDDNVYERILTTETQTQDNSVYSYFIDELTDQVINDLMSVKGYTETQARNALYSGGLDIYTTQDPNIQAIVDEEYSNPDNYPYYTQYAPDFAFTVTNAKGEEVNYSKEMMALYFKDQDPSFDLLFDSPEEGQTYVDQYIAAILSEPGTKEVARRVNFIPQPQSSMTVIDQHTGYVKAICGGRGEKTASLTLNRATDINRQPGSTFKIVSTYAPALDAKGMTLATTFDDEEGYTYPSGEPIKNSDNTYRGETTIREAIRRSVNVVAVKCLEEVTPQLGIEYLKKFGFTTLADGSAKDTDANGNVYSDVGLPTALGGISYGVKNVELNAAYACIANGGKYIKPIFYTKILDKDGNVLIDNTPVSETVISESTAYLLTSAMEDVVKSGTGTMCQLSNMPVAGKTGTTEKVNDLWFVGYTPYYTCAVWSGYDNNEKIPEDQRNFHKGLWQKVMSRIHADLEEKDFEMPVSVEKTSVCSDTGLLPRSSCPTIYEYFDIKSLPTERCDKHYYTYTPRSYDTKNENEDDENNTGSENGNNTQDPNATPSPTGAPDGGEEGNGNGSEGGGSDGPGEGGGNGSGEDGGNGSEDGGDGGTDEDPEPPA